MAKVMFIVAFLLSTVGFAADKVQCPETIPVVDLYGNLLDILVPSSPFALEAVKGCLEGRGGVSKPCVLQVIIINEERVTVICGSGEVIPEI